MTRREFLKALGLLAAAAALPDIPALASYPHFDPAHQYGNYKTVTDFVDKEILRLVQEEFEEEISQVVPPEHRSQIKWIIRQPDPKMQFGDSFFTGRGAVAWKYSPKH